MNRLERLTQSYSKYISVPWRDDAAAAQRVIFCVYNETEERWLRAKVDEFEIVTRQAGVDQRGIMTPFSQETASKIDPTMLPTLWHEPTEDLEDVDSGDNCEDSALPFYRGEKYQRD